MKIFTPLRMIAIVASLAVLAAACSSSGDVAATVNGADITVVEVESLISDETEQDESVFSESLSTLIQWKITNQAASDDLGVVVTDEQVDAELDRFLSDFGGPSPEDFAASQGITEALLTSYVHQLVVQDAVTESFTESAEPVSDAEVAVQIAAAPLTWTEVCVAHFLVATQEEATDAMERLEAGEAFADVAAEVSVDTGSSTNGGDLGCRAADTFVEPFAVATLEAPLGEPYGPAESEFGFHVILVTSRTEATIEGARAVLLQSAALDEVDAWFIQVVEAADVVVDEQYGTWITDPSPQIVVSTG